MPKVCLLGTAQDGGRPQVGCFKSCCIGLKEQDRCYPVALGIEGDDGSRHLVEASRHLGEQLALWGGVCIPCGGIASAADISSLSITHAHFGHIDGLGLFGRETMSKRGITLYTSESLLSLINRTPQWDLMMQQGVFESVAFQTGDVLHPASKFNSSATSPDRITSDSKNDNTCGFTLEPIKVPHRAELSDMHAFIIRGKQRSLLFLPDHDSWEETLALYNVTTIREYLRLLKVDIALLDGTFWSKDELGIRDGGGGQNEVPHPPVLDQLQLLGARQDNDPEIIFIHFNHTNPLYNSSSMEYKHAVEMGWGVGEQGWTCEL